MYKHSIIYAFAFLTCFPVIALGDIYRGCTSEYRIKVTHADGQVISRNEVGLGRFSAQGKCRGKAWANDCRRAARSYALECTQAHWNERWERKRPGLCNRRGSIGPQNYILNDLKAEIEWYACFGGGAPAFRDEVILKLRSVTWGDKRCNGQVELSDNYRVTEEMCAAVDSKLELPPSKR